MKTNHKKPLTFGNLVASAYSACKRRKANAILRFAINTHLVVFRGQKHYVIR